MIELGQKVKFDSTREVKGLHSRNTEKNIVTGTVAYINVENKWFLVEYICHDATLRTAFKFSDIGEAVTICG